MKTELSLLDRATEYEWSLGSKLNIALNNIEGMFSMWGACILDDESEPELQVLADVRTELNIKRGNYKNEVVAINNLLSVIRYDVFPNWDNAFATFETGNYDEKEWEKNEPINKYKKELQSVHDVVNRLKEEEQNLPTLKITLSGTNHDKELEIRGTAKGMYDLDLLIRDKVENFLSGLNSLGTEK